MMKIVLGLLRFKIQSKTRLKVDESAAGAFQIAHLRGARESEVGMGVPTERARAMVHESIVKQVLHSLKRSLKKTKDS